MCLRVSCHVSISQGLQTLGHVAMAADASARQLKHDFDAAQTAMATAAQDSAVRAISRRGINKQI